MGANQEERKTVVSFSVIVCIVLVFFLHRKGKGSIGKVKETKGQKKTANRGEKKSEEKEGKAKAKEGKAKPRAPRGLSRALTKLAKQ